MSLKKAEAEKAAKENQIRSLQDEMKQQVTKLLPKSNLFLFSYSLYNIWIFCYIYIYKSYYPQINSIFITVTLTYLQDESITKLSKERKQQEEANKKLQDDLQAAEEANLANQKLRQRLQQTIEDVEQSLDREKRSRADADKVSARSSGCCDL